MVDPDIQEAWKKEGQKLAEKERQEEAKSKQIARQLVRKNRQGGSPDFTFDDSPITVLRPINGMFEKVLEDVWENTERMEMLIRYKTGETLCVPFTSVDSMKIVFNSMNAVKRSQQG